MKIEIIHETSPRSSGHYVKIRKYVYDMLDDSSTSNYIFMTISDYSCNRKLDIMSYVMNDYFMDNHKNLIKYLADTKNTDANILSVNYYNGTPDYADMYVVFPNHIADKIKIPRIISKKYGGLYVDLSGLTYKLTYY